MTKHWHLVAYDVRSPKRLYHVHRRLSGEAMAVQQSVFLLRASQRKLKELLNELEAIIDIGADDLRAYPVSHPAQLWLSGQIGAAAEEVNLAPVDAEQPAVAQGWIKRWLTQLGAL